MANLAHQHIALPRRGRTRYCGGRAGGRGCRGHGRDYDAPGNILWDQAGRDLAAPFADNSHTTIRIG